MMTSLIFTFIIFMWSFFLLIHINITKKDKETHIFLTGCWVASVVFIIIAMLFTYKDIF